MALRRGFSSAFDVNFGDDRVTQLHPNGLPGRKYGRFAAKSSSLFRVSGWVTRLGLYGGPAGRYGTFDPKGTAVATPANIGLTNRRFIRNMGTLMR